MRVSMDEKKRSHERIVASAARLVRERGVDRTGIVDVMSDAGLSHGGFYRHFETKDALVGATLDAGFAQLIQRLETEYDRHDPATAVAVFQADYMSAKHVAEPGIGCPMAAVGSEIGHSPDALKTTFGAGVNRLIAALVRGTSGSPRERRARATRELAMMLGAVIMARASDPKTADDVLAACRKGVKDA